MAALAPATTKTTRRPHALLIPYPCSGHINPTLHFARLLRSAGVLVTFVNTEHNHAVMVRGRGRGHDADADAGAGGFIRYEAIPDGLAPSERGAQDHSMGLLRAVLTHCPGHLRALIVKLNGGGGACASAAPPPVTCVVASELMSFALDVAADLGLPSYMLWGTSACGLACGRAVGELRRRGHVPLKDESYLTNGYLDTPIDWIPGLPAVRLGDISSFVRTLDPQCFALRVEEDEANSCARARGLILNTFDDLEPDVLGALCDEFPRVYTIGPLAAAMHMHTHTISLWEEDTGCMSWLDAQADGSVLYVSFGSLAVLSPEQVAELAWGLAASGRPFLWAVRPGLAAGDHRGGADALPEAFVAETSRGRCFIAEWCAQEQVLRHRAVGGFLTHSGWNSTAESICAGVPMLCWPGFADQYINSRYACEEWGIGLRLDETLRRRQVAAYVEELMGDTETAREMRRSAAQWKAAAEAATAPGGSSFESLGRLVEELRRLGDADADDDDDSELATATPPPSQGR